MVFFEIRVRDEAMAGDEEGGDEEGGGLRDVF